MTFEDVLSAIANAYGLDSYDLIGYSYEDEISGWDGGFGDWPIGSLWTVEGRILYALIRALQPDVVVEIGTNVGCSASHMASALKENGHGKLMSFDTNKSIMIPPDKTGHSQVFEQGQLIPDDLRPWVELVNADGIAYLREYIAEADFIFEDGAHGFEGTRDAWIAGLEKLNPGGLMLSHDAAHFLVGETIQKGIAAAGVVPNIYEVQPSDCGLAIYRKPTDAEKPEPAKAEAAQDIPLEEFVPHIVIPESERRTPEEAEAFYKEYYAEKPYEPNFNNWTEDELRDYADAHDIDLGRLRKRESIIERLQEES